MNSTITDSERLAALKKHLAVVNVDAFECDALLTFKCNYQSFGAVYFQSKDDFTVEAALDYLVMEERNKCL